MENNERGMRLVTAVTLLISFFTLVLILAVDLVTSQLPLLENALDILDVGVGEGKVILYMAWAGSFAASIIIDVRRNKNRKDRQEVRHKS